MTKLAEAWERAIRLRSRKVEGRSGSLSYRYDPDADALSIIIKPGVTSAKTVEVDESLYVDLDAEASPIAIEILSASAGFSLHDLFGQFALWEQETDLKEIQNTPFSPSDA